MQRWLVAVTFVVVACKAKRDDVPQPAHQVVVADDDPAAPVAAMVTSLPPACELYRAMVERLEVCHALPATTRKALHDGFERESAGWSRVPAAGRDALADACKVAAAEATARVAMMCPEVAGPSPFDPSAAGSRIVPGEKGVPFDQTVLGPLPHPFGALEVLRPGMSREDILSALPSARRDGDDKIIVALGVEDLMADVMIDYSGHLDWVVVRLPADGRDQLVKSWGQPSATETWFDRKRRWRADLEGNELTIGGYRPLAEVLGKGPDGLAETKAVLGATVAELEERFGARIAEHDRVDDTGDATDGKWYELLLPATDVCKSFTQLRLDLGGGRFAKVVTKATLRQCYDGTEANRRAALAAMEQRWGRVIPSRSADDLPMFTFNVPGRRVELSLATIDDVMVWDAVITAK